MVLKKIGYAMSLFVLMSFCACKKQSTRNENRAAPAPTVAHSMVTPTPTVANNAQTTETLTAVPVK